MHSAIYTRQTHVARAKQLNMILHAHDAGCEHFCLSLYRLDPHTVGLSRTIKRQPNHKPPAHSRQLRRCPAQSPIGVPLGVAAEIRAVEVGNPDAGIGVTLQHKAVVAKTPRRRRVGVSFSTDEQRRSAAIVSRNSAARQPRHPGLSGDFRIGLITALVVSA